MAIEALADLDALLEEDWARLAAREQGCQIPLAGFVASQFRSARLFHAAAQPAAPLLRYMLAQILMQPALAALMSTSLDAALRAVEGVLEAAFAAEQAPIHPGVAAHFGLGWWDAALDYRQGALSGDGAFWISRAFEASRPPAPPALAATLHPGGLVHRVAPYFATWINPEVARHGAALLDAAAAQYAAPPLLLGVLMDGTVEGRSGGVSLRGAAARRRPGASLLGFGPDWRADNQGLATVLPRLVAFERLRRHGEAEAILLPRGAQGPWLLAAIDLLGLPMAAIDWLGDESVACAALLTVSGLDTDAIAPAVADAARVLAGMVPLGAAALGRPLLMHTEGWGPDNLADCAAVLRPMGFELVDAAQLDLAARIALLARLPRADRAAGRGAR